MSLKDIPKFDAKYDIWQSLNLFFCFLPMSNRKMRLRVHSANNEPWRIWTDVMCLIFSAQTN